MVIINATVLGHAWQSERCLVAAKLRVADGDILALTRHDTYSLCMVSIMCSVRAGICVRVNKFVCVYANVTVHADLACVFAGFGVCVREHHSAMRENKHDKKDQHCCKTSTSGHEGNMKLLILSAALTQRQLAVSSPWTRAP